MASNFHPVGPPSASGPSSSTTSSNAPYPPNPYIVPPPPPLTTSNPVTPSAANPLPLGGAMPPTTGLEIYAPQDSTRYEDWYNRSDLQNMLATLPLPAFNIAKEFFGQFNGPYKLLHLQRCLELAALKERLPPKEYRELKTAEFMALKQFTHYDPHASLAPLGSPNHVHYAAFLESEKQPIQQQINRLYLAFLKTSTEYKCLLYRPYKSKKLPDVRDRAQELHNFFTRGNPVSLSATGTLKNVSPAGTIIRHLHAPPLLPLPPNQAEVLIPDPEAYLQNLIDKLQQAQAQQGLRRYLYKFTTLTFWPPKDWNFRSLDPYQQTLDRLQCLLASHRQNPTAIPLRLEEVFTNLLTTKERDEIVPPENSSLYLHTADDHKLTLALKSLWECFPGEYDFKIDPTTLPPPNPNASSFGIEISDATAGSPTGVPTGIPPGPQPSPPQGSSSSIHIGPTSPRTR